MFTSICNPLASASVKGTCAADAKINLEVMTLTSCVLCTVDNPMSQMPSGFCGSQCNGKYGVGENVVFRVVVSASRRGTVREPSRDVDYLA